MSSYPILLEDLGTDRLRSFCNKEINIQSLYTPCLEKELARVYASIFKREKEMCPFVIKWKLRMLLKAYNF